MRIVHECRDLATRTEATGQFPGAVSRLRRVLGHVGSDLHRLFLTVREVLNIEDSTPLNLVAVETRSPTSFDRCSHDSFEYFCRGPLGRISLDQPWPVETKYAVKVHESSSLHFGNLQVVQLRQGFEVGLPQA